MPVPEAAVYKNYLLKPRENEIRFSWKIPDVKAIAEPHRMDNAPD